MWILIRSWGSSGGSIRGNGECDYEGWMPRGVIQRVGGTWGVLVLESDRVACEIREVVRDVP